MFVKKLVEKAASNVSKKPSGVNGKGLKANDIEPRLSFHYGIPSGANILASHSHPSSSCLAVSTRDGRIKLYGKDNTQALLHSPDALPTKFLKFVQTGSTLVLLNVTSSNHIEVWDVEKRLLSHIHVFPGDITSFTPLRHTPFIYVGDSAGNVTVLKLEPDLWHLTRMQYSIPLSAGNPTQAASVVTILPVPSAETKRLLVVYQDGVIILWDIQESRSIFTTGTSTSLLPSQNHHEAVRKATCACWGCPYGSKVIVGYSNGEIFTWSVQASVTETPTPSSKLNLGYKLDKVAIASLKWFPQLDGNNKASRLYVMGGSSSEVAPTSSVQVVLLNEHSETRTIKLGLHLPEPCIDMDIISSSKLVSLVLLGKSGHVYAYDDGMIEKYLIQSQAKISVPSSPKEVMAKLPYIDSSISAAKFVTNNPSLLNSADEDYAVLARNVPSVLPFEGKLKEGSNMNSVHKFTGFSKIKNVYITGHKDGAINFWDVSCPLPIPVLSLTQQSEDDLSSSGIPVTALYFDGDSRLLISGDQSGIVRVFKLKPEPYASENGFMSFQGSSRKGNSHVIQSLKLIKVTGAILSITVSHSSGRVAVGSDQGNVSVIDIEGQVPNMLYQQHIASELSAGIISLKFETCNLHGFEKKTLVVATRDSSVLALDCDSGNMLSTETVHPNKPSRALYMEILDGQSVQDDETGAKDGASKQPSVLMCSEKAVYVYSLNHIAQGVKKVIYKKKFNSSSCLWASTFWLGSDVGLVLLLSSGKLEIRSLPELSLLRESSIRDFSHFEQRTNYSISCSLDGEIFLVNGDQEIFVVSISLQKDNFRLVDTFSQVYTYDPMSSLEGPAATLQKEKKKGIFSSLSKSKSKQVPDQMETEDAKESIEELAVIFSSANFACDDDHQEIRELCFHSLLRSHDSLLDEDDIEIDDDPVEKPAKDQNIMAALNKQKLVMASRLQAFKGKVVKEINKKTHNSSVNSKELVEQQGDNGAGGGVDQIKKKYGFSSSTETMGAARMAESKLQDNVNKLQGINMKAAAMQDTAKSFSSMAKELLRLSEKNGKTASSS
ncbi:unnamed protein product [Linum tenue]|uniref:Lethal giant larvae (Lgl)-like C-terminal domain-containing protein n=1 Tax=Linum tenue TaxID=586396 RepID=A0AAV0KJS3_9ROSI|nr:unnamed protein product [Linum tenue]